MGNYTVPVTKKPLNDLEVIDTLQALFPDELGIDDDDYQECETLLWKKFEITVEQFAQVAGHLLTLTPLMQSGITQALDHAFGTNIFEGEEDRTALRYSRFEATATRNCVGK